MTKECPTSIMWFRTPRVLPIRTNPNLLTESFTAELSIRA